MNKLSKRLVNTLSVAIASVVLSFNATALDSSVFATSSKLATGKWVKIKVAKTGVYELTDAELTAMGFANPANVRIYGNGGYMISELLDGSAVDDLKQVPAQRFGSKLVFYAKGVTQFTMTDFSTGKPRFTRTLNPYSTTGCYFLCESGDPEMSVPDIASGVSASRTRSTNINYYWHESELLSLGQTGKSFLGEDLNTGDGVFDYYLPDLCRDSAMVVGTSVAAKWVADVEGIVTATLNATDAVPFVESQAKIRKVTRSDIIYCNQASPYAAVVPTVYAEKGKIKIGLNYPDGKPEKLYLDNFIITYQRANAIPDKDSQVAMNFVNLSANDRIFFPSADDNLVVWNVDNPNAPRNFQLNASMDGQAFVPAFSARWAQFVAFDPTKQLYKIEGFENVENQNIHAQPVPHMIILTDKVFHAQAERIANMHRVNDGLDVLIVDQQQVFNEFSSGTQDPMAVRLMNKMFYDRDNTKFKYFLVLGCGSYDNRGLLSNKPNRVITYESDNSSDETSSFCSDDFYGFMDDNSGYDIAADKLRLAVGRIPSATIEEAKTDVDKLLNYVNDPDYGPWRNNTLATADQDKDNENGIHYFQAEGITEIISDASMGGMSTEKVYVPMYPKATAASESGTSLNSRTAVTASQRMANLLKEGQYFMTYVGHAGPTCFSAHSRLWTSGKTMTTTYEHLPIFTTACCDVARYDSDSRGVAEVMFHSPHGGAIALFTSARSVFADKNDILNRAFVEALFSYAQTGKMGTVGDAYLAAKNTFGNTRDVNKMSFLLLGDPAMAINYPKPLVKITKINNYDITKQAVWVKPLYKVTVEAQVMREGTDEIDTDFNGTATATLYDSQEYFQTLTNSVNRKAVTRDIHYPREVLAKVDGEVVNGKFKATLVMPRQMQASVDSLLLRVYAHKTGTHEMVNGATNALIGQQISNANELYVDNTPPVITGMFFNEGESTPSTVIPSNSTLYVTAEDNYALNVQETSGSGTMTLTLDGGKNAFPEIKNFARLTNEGKNMQVALQMRDLQHGPHTATLVVYDAAGNSAQRTISFFVGNADVSLEVAEIPATNRATFSMSTELDVTPQITLKITDATGNMVAVKKNATFPFVWDLKGDNGQRVPDGLYRFFGTFENGNINGGTPIYNLIVRDIK